MGVRAQKIVHSGVICFHGRHPFCPIAQHCHCVQLHLPSMYLAGRFASKPLSLDRTNKVKPLMTYWGPLSFILHDEVEVQLPACKIKVQTPLTYTRLPGGMALLLVRDATACW